MSLSLRLYRSPGLNIARVHAGKKLALTLGIVLGLASMAWGLSGPQTASPVRAIWVTRLDYRTADDVKRIMDTCSAAGFNTVLFQVRGNATVFYRSQIEPWAEQLGFADPGFDPLARACAEAHARDMQLHAWVNVMPAWRGEKAPENPKQIYHTHPEWFWYDQHGNRQALSWFYVSLNPCLPEVRAYLVEVFREIVANHDVDGLHMDYIRFPKEPPATPKGSGSDYPRDKRTLALFSAETGSTPDENPKAWAQWRTDQVTRLVAGVQVMLGAVKPGVAVSVCVGTNRQRSLDHFRDGTGWAERGLVDVVYPMNYKPDLQKFKEGLSMWLPLRGAVTVVPGLWFDRRLPPDEGIDVARQQIEYALAATGNVCVFSYASLFDTGGHRQDRLSTNAAAGRQAGGERRWREKRRHALLPLLQPEAP